MDKLCNQLKFNTLLLAFLYYSVDIYTLGITFENKIKFNQLLIVFRQIMGAASIP